MYLKVIVWYLKILSKELDFVLVKDFKEFSKEIDELARMIYRFVEAVKNKWIVYVITKNNHPGLISYNPNAPAAGTDYQEVEAVMLVDGQRYTVFVSNDNEPGKRKLPDLMTFWIRPDGTTSPEYLTIFSDYGLDGRCNFGVLFEKMSGIGKTIEFRDGTDGTKPEGLEHRNRFQDLYNKTLETLIKFYEKSK